MSRLVVDAQNLTKVYTMGEVEVHALRDASVRIKAGEAVAIMGPSGSGKSTLMNILGALDRPTNGSYSLDGEEVSQMSDERLADVRNRKVGFVFQNYNLLPRATALANVQLPLRYSRQDGDHRRERALQALDAVGLHERSQHRPNELSGGQQQRVAIARAIINRPSIIMADEPTGNLDSKSGEEVMQLLLQMNKDLGTTLIIITHDADIANSCRRVINIRDGVTTEVKQLTIPLRLWMRWKASAPINCVRA
jgi:putative ABC transport system ATP-binding protein